MMSSLPHIHSTPIMASKHSPPTLSTKKSKSMSKTEEKMTLVAKRLSMLQNDAQIHDSSSTVSEETPLQYKSHKGTMVVYDQFQEDEKLQCSIQPIEKESDSLNRENLYGASDNSRNLKMNCKLVEPLDNNPEPSCLTIMERATKVQENLSAEYPSFVKMMVPSNVSGSFWMFPPKKFCTANLPKESCIVVLVDEGGREFKTKYLVHRTGLSGGWAGFATHHDLRKGDVLVFHLIHPTTFKVYIIREDRLDEGDGAPKLLGSEEDGNMQCLTQPIKKEKGTKRKRVCNHSQNHENLDETSDSQRDLKMDNFTESKYSSATMDRATKFQANLTTEYPSFVKMMTPSNVSGCFWMHPPRKFCDVNLPKENCTVVLVDEGGREFQTKYLAHQRGISGGWKGFSGHHKLQKGDVLVFHLIHPITFKVYVFREDRVDEVDGAVGPGLLELDTCGGQMISGDFTQKVLHTEDISLLDSLSPSNNSTDTQPEVLDGIRFSNSCISFEAVKGFEDFNINVDGLIIDSKFSIINRKKYYELCHSQNSYLHQQLLKGLNYNLIVGMILETVNIADATKACNSSTSIEDLQTWKQTLNGFQHLGMKVSFLCAKLNQLLGIAFELNEADSSNRSEICTPERGCDSDKMLAIEDKVVELKGIVEKIDLEVKDEITASVENHKAVVKEIANKP